MLHKPHFMINRIESDGHEEAYLMREISNPIFSYAFITEGEVLAEVNGNNYLVRPGQFILVPENQTIIIRHFRDCVGYDGAFSLDFLKDASYAVLRATQPIVQSFWFDDAVFIGALLKRMMTGFGDKDVKLLQSGMDLILGQLRAKSHIAAVPEIFLQLVFDRNCSPLTVSEYADKLNVTANYLNKTVKAHTLRTAIDWIEIARLNLAKQLLKDPSIPIAEIAVRTGLADQSYFARFFKKKTGLTPSQYREGQ